MASARASGGRLWTAVADASGDSDLAGGQDVEKGAGPVLRGRHRTAFLAAVAARGGLRRQAHPSAMPYLAALGLVEARPVRRAGARPGETAWFLTAAGRRVAQAMAADRD